MNTLTKNAGTTITIPGSPGVPGNPGRPAVPARCWNETYTETVYSVSDPAGAQYADLNGDGIPELLPDSNSITVTSNPVITSTVATRTRQVCSPALPAIPSTPGKAPTPAQTFSIGGLGWNARARSKVSSVGSFNIRFEVPVTTVGAIVGVTDRPDADSGYVDIKFGLLVERGQARLIRSGNVGVVVPYGVFGLRMVNGFLDVLVDDVVEYSTNVAYNPSTQYWMAAAMYAGGDQVLNAEFLTAGGSPDPEPYVDGGENYGLLAPLTGSGFEASALVQGGVAMLRPLQVVSRMAARGWGFLTELDVFGGAGAYGEGTSTLAPLAGGGTGPGFIAPAFAFSFGYLSPLAGLGGGTMGNTGDGEAVLLPLTGLGSDRPYGQSRAAVSPLYGSGGAVAANEAFAVSVTGVGTSLLPEAVVLVSFTSGFEVSSVISAAIAHDVVMDASLYIASTGASAADLEATLYSVLSLPEFAAATSLQQWAVNMDADVSRFTNYGFNSFAKVGGKYYGARADGVYLLEGSSDVGQAIDVGVLTGRLDFGTAVLKRIENLYVGVSSSDYIYVRVDSEGQRYTYRARDKSSALQQQRVDVGKGLRSNFFEFELIGKGPIEISGVEFRAVPLSRRI